MSGKIFNTRVKNKRDSVSNWTDKNPILLDGEVVVVDSTDGESRFKIGDGTKHYSELPFQDEYLQNEINNKAAIEAGVYTAVASSSDGVAYTSTVPGISELSTGASFIMIPDKTSASKEPTLDVNGLGEKKIRRRLSAITTSLQSGYSNTWISANKPFQVVYDGTAWVVEGMAKPVGADVYGAVPQATADVNKSIAQYGDNVIFTATPSSQNYDFFGWYADAAYTNLVSIENPYNCTVTTDIKLYPKFGLKNYNLIVHPTGYDKINFNGATNIENVEILYKNSSKETSTDTVATWAIGELNKSDNPASVGFFIDGAKFSSIPANATITNINVSMKVKADSKSGASIVSNTSRGFYTAKKEINGDSFSYIQIGTTTYKNVIIDLNEDSQYSDYLIYTISNKEAGEWTIADLKSGSFGIVWLASSPSITSNGGVSKHLIHNIDISVSYTLPEEYITSTTLYFKVNGSYKSATKVYKKVSGTWVEQADLPAIFSGEPSGGASNYVYGGSV